MWAAEGGAAHVRILASDAVAARAPGEPSFFLSFRGALEGRRTHALAYDADFGEWLHARLNAFRDAHR